MKYKNFHSFKKNRAFVRSLNLKSQKEWQAYCKSGKKPDNIPATPDRVYKNKGWLSLGDWLGTKSGFNGFLPFEEGRAFAHTLGLKTQKEWKVYCKSGKKPDNIPAYPNDIYKNKGWLSLGDWLGTKPGFDGFVPFEEGRAFAHTLGLKTQKEWKVYYKSGKNPNNIPSRPDITYKDNGWISWGDWLGTKPGFDGFLPFEEGRAFAHTLGLKTQKEWRIYCKSGKKPDSIPAHPNDVYKNKGWVSWGDWLCMSLNELKLLLKKNNIKNQEEYYKLVFIQLRR